MAFAGRRNLSARLGRVVVCGERDLPRDLTRRGLRLSADQVARLVAVLDAACPPRVRRTPVLRRRTVRVQTKPDAQFALLSEEEILAALREAACAEPIETWMTWLHPRQARLVAQRWSGPARIRGAAGTGKTVVALHRAKHLAASGKRVLFTSFVRTLPAVHQQLFTRLAPDVPGHVEFVGLHAWAGRLLASRGVRLDLSDGRTCFNLAWAHVGRGSILDDLSVPPDYWREEITSVIKGRGITAYDDYAALTRVGRRTALQPVHREAVWRLFLEYERLRVMRGQHDFADLLLLAIESVQASPVTPAYDAVIVDEVQDLSCIGLRLLHALVGEAPDGLLLVGDGQQAVYPGGFTLTEAGVSVVGRSRVLDRNYRNGSTIVAAALSVVAEDVYDDLEADSFSGVREVDVERSGGTVIRAVTAAAAQQAAALVAQIRGEVERGGRLGDLAVLCPSNAEVSRWLATLSGAGLAAIALADYDGHTVDAVKVGTYQRAKGLEFAGVFIPDHNRVPAPRRDGESDDAFAERAALERRQPSSP